MSHAGLGLREEPLYKGTVGAWDLGYERSLLHTRRLKSQHHANSSSTSTTTAHAVSSTRTLHELHRPSRLTSVMLFLGPGVLVSRGRLPLFLPLSARASLPRLALTQSATPSRPCYKRLGLLFAVGENFSKGYGRFLHSLHFR